MDNRFTGADLIHTRWFGYCQYVALFHWCWTWNNDVCNCPQLLGDKKFIGARRIHVRYLGLWDFQDGSQDGYRKG